MTETSQRDSDTAVRKSVVVQADVQRAFEVFTDDVDAWWPRNHHIGDSPMKRVIIEGRVGGRCYTEQVDGTDCDWGRVLAWEPPRRFVLAWQITLQWKYQPDLARSSEVEVRFTPLSGARTRVDLEHRYLERHGPGFDGMRSAVDSPNGWDSTLARYAERAAAGGDR